MKIPSSVEIFGQRVSVRVVDLTDITPGAAGFYDPRIESIFIHSDLSDKDAAVTLVHEMVHALASRLNWIGAIDHDVIELLCDHVAVAVVENFKLSARK